MHFTDISARERVSGNPSRHSSTLVAVMIVDVTDRDQCIAIE